MKRLFDYLKRLLFILLIFIFSVPLYAHNEGNDYKRPNITYSKNEYKVKHNDYKYKHDTYKYKHNTYKHKHNYNKYHKHHPNAYHSYKRKYYARTYYYIVVGHNNHIYKVYNNGLRVHSKTLCWCN